MWTSIIIISILGTISHFLYDISGHNKIIGLFTSVNESTWEHIKIGLSPTILYSLYDGYVFGSNPNYFFAKLCSLLSITLVIPLIYYSYKSILKKDITLINISSFYIAIIVSQFAFDYIINSEPIEFIYQYISCIFLFIFFGAYLLLTLLPLKSFLFKDPITNKYGFSGHASYK